MPDKVTITNLCSYLNSVVNHPNTLNSLNKNSFRGFFYSKKISQLFMVLSAIIVKISSHLDHSYCLHWPCKDNNDECYICVTCNLFIKLSIFNFYRFHREITDKYEI